MNQLVEKCSKNMYKLIANVLYSVGVISVNSACSSVYNQPKEPKTLKRFVK